MQLRGRAREASREGDIEMRPEDEGERWRVDEKSHYQAELGQEDFSGGNREPFTVAGASVGETGEDQQRPGLPGFVGRF